MFYFRIVPLYLLIVNILGYTAPHYDLENAEQHFTDFIKKYERKYESAEEYSKRFQIFKTNLKKINEWNDYNKHDKGGYEVTRFSDQDSYRPGVGAFKPLNRTCTIPVKREFIGKPPDHLDYREKNFVTEVKDQGPCDSCYDVFAAIGNIEGMHAKRSGNLVSLSEQQALDCYHLRATPAPDRILEDVVNVIDSLVEQGGSMSEQDYPYVGEQGTCHTDQSKIQAKVRASHVISTLNPDMLKRALYTNGAPLAIRLYASPTVRHSVGFVILKPDDCHFAHPNHAALLVGYTKDPTTDRFYWITKNSWGTEHGDKGYLYFDFDCQCNIAAKGAVTSTVR